MQSLAPLHRESLLSGIATVDVVELPKVPPWETDFYTPPVLGGAARSNNSASAVYRSRNNYQYSTEGQKSHENSAPVLVIISGNSLVFSRKFLPVLVFTGTAPPTRQHQ